MRKSLFIILFLVLCGFVYFYQRDQPLVQTPAIETESEIVRATPTPKPLLDLKTRAVGLAASPVSKAQAPSPSVSMNVEGRRVTIQASAPQQLQKSGVSNLRRFTAEDGVAVIDGDIVLGVPSNSAQTGIAQLPSLALWPTREIPYFIQPSLPNPGRVLDALKLFSSTLMRFVPYTDQDDVLVFQESTENCKSYVGKTGGKQPLWLSPACGPHEIAHEIMHALGFTHEQNRFDRDKSIRLNPQNIDETKIVNFEKMPEEFMQLTGQSDFSFTSIMIYPPSMFSKTGQPTMAPLSASEQIAPSSGLSREDIDRINKVYGSR